ncbi:MAG TPA: PKD domain-containing protein [Thermoanaerobaculia bacterium]
MKHIPVYWQTCVLAVLVAALFLPVASATTIVMPTDEQLVVKSPDIVEGTVLSSVPVQIGNRIWTETQVVVSRTIKGDAAGTITIREIGGQIGDNVTKIFGAPEYTVGENVLLFLTPTPRGDFQTTDLFVGKFTADQMLDGTPMWIRKDQTADVSLLDADFRPMRAGNIQRAAQGFEQFVADRVAGRAGTHGYTVENPVLRSVVATDGGQRFKAVDDFTLISEPTIYRWGLFDQGLSANWYSYGTQPGYTGGGVNEITTAMSSWSSYSAANIKYAYAGSEATGAGMNTNNGRNEVLFNDPFGDIAGSWNPSTGGVVGLGGFNGVSGSGTFTATFTADASHTAGAKSYTKISEANLTIQDGVSSNAGIPSSELAEIVAHEFGHTLGFGHSSDSTALMYAYVTGLGPSLRTDDQTAARWLYPNGSSSGGGNPGTPPAAPSNLTAAQSGSNVVLNWTDNANNETAEQVYASAGSGSYGLVTTLGSGAATVTLTGFTTGTYHFYITASNSYGTSAASNIAQVNYSGSNPTPPPAASFNVNTMSGTAGQTTFSFTDTSSGTITSRLWTFGDGATASNTTNPTHVYNAAGVFTVTLTVTNSSGSNSATTNLSVSAPIPATPQVTAAFNFTPSNPVTAQVMSFSDQSSGSPTSWSWDFGDGVQSTSQNPTHAYAYANTYTISLTVRNSGSTSVASHTVTVNSASQTARTLVSAAAQTSGVGGSSWRTELTLFNAGSDTLSVNLFYIPSFGNAVQSRGIVIGGKQTITYANALTDLYGINSGAGAIAIEATSSSGAPQLRVTSRTFTDGVAGTYGQAVPTVGSSDFSGNLYLTGMASSTSFRTNIGLVNRGDSDATVILTLFDSNGSQVASANVAVPANNFQQSAISQLFTSLATRSFDSLSMKVTSNAPDALSVYASVIDNKTQDPIYIQATPGGAPSPVILPAVGRAPGVGGTFWRSDVTIYNPGSSNLTLGVRYLAAGSDDRNAPSQSLSVGAGRTVVLSDVLQQFNVSSGSGALELTWSNGVSPIVTSRTYTPATTGGTYGQSIDPITAFGSDLYVTGLRSDNAFRSNVGFVNDSDQTIAISLTLFASSGAPVANGLITLAPRSQAQSALSSIFPDAAISSLGSVTLQAHSDSGAMFAYGSMIDNTSGDPVFFAGQ